VSDELLTLAQAARALQITYDRAAELAREGILPLVRLGRQIRICPARLSAFISQGGQAWPGG
jgi:excisionase family DNA binding protein